MLMCFCVKDFGELRTLQNCSSLDFTKNDTKNGINDIKIPSR